MQLLESQIILHNIELHCTTNEYDALWTNKQTKYSSFSKGITTLGPDPAEANTKEALVVFVLHM